MELIYNTPSTKGEDARIRVFRGTISIERNTEPKAKASKFQKNGMLLDLLDQGDLLPIGPYDDVLCDPILNISVNERNKELVYKLKGRGADSMPLGKAEILQILRGQHELAGAAYERLTSRTFPPQLESRKYIALEMLENIMDFGVYNYLDFEFKRQD